MQASPGRITPESQRFQAVVVCGLLPMLRQTTTVPGATEISAGRKKPSWIPMVTRGSSEIADARTFWGSGPLPQPRGSAAELTVWVVPTVVVPTGQPKPVPPMPIQGSWQDASAGQAGAT